MIDGYIDMACMHSALAVLERGENSGASRWHWSNLVEVTYFLMWDNIKVTPGTRLPGPASGPYEHVVRVFPNVASPSRPSQTAREETRAWLNTDFEQLSRAWADGLHNSEFVDWVQFQRDTFWVRHSEVYGALCEEEWIPDIARVLNQEEATIRLIHRDSRDPTAVKQWLKERHNSPMPGLASIAEDVWVVGGMIRGVYHESSAASEGYQLLQHQFRKGIQRHLQEGKPQDLSGSEELFTKMLIKSALDQADADARLSAWAKYTRASRDLLVADPNMIREARTEGDLDLMLRTAAQRAGIPQPPSAGSKLIDAAIKLNIPKLISYSLSLWNPMLAPLGATAEVIAPSLSKQLRRKSRRRYEALEAAKSVPGRIERRFA